MPKKKTDAPAPEPVEEVAQAYKAEIVIDAGAVVTVNGLEVTLNENVHCTINAAQTPDQAAELVHIHKLPLELDTFAHTDEGKNVDVSYNRFNGQRIETPKK